jgi:hypothetical protein
MQGAKWRLLLLLAVALRPLLTRCVRLVSLSLSLSLSLSFSLLPVPCVCASNSSGFLNNPKRFNVSLTRAKAGLIVVGNGKLLARDPNWRRFISYCMQHKAVKGDLTPADLEAAGSDAGGGAAAPGVMAGAAELMQLLQATEQQQQREAAQQLRQQRAEDAVLPIGEQRNADASFERHD